MKTLNLHKLIKQLNMILSSLKNENSVIIYSH